MSRFFYFNLEGIPDGKEMVVKREFRVQMIIRSN